MNGPAAALSVWIGGAVEDRPEFLGRLLARAFARNGLQIQASLCGSRGGPLLFRADVSNAPILASAGCDLLLALNSVALNREASRAAFGLVYDSGCFEPGGLKQGARSFSLPSSELSRGPEGRPMALFGAAAALLGLTPEVFDAALNTEERQALRAGWDHAARTWALRLEAPEGRGAPRPMLSGGEAFAAGALAAGARFFALDGGSAEASLGAWLGPRAAGLGALVEKFEAPGEAAHAAVGAAHAGLRSVCAVSSEAPGAALGLCALAEIPSVFWVSQRAAGLPEQSGQAGLAQVLGAASGEAAKIILAPWDAADALKAAGEALNLAEAWQLPVLVLSDRLLDERLETPEDFELDFPIGRGPWAKPEAGGTWRRYAGPDSVISPRSAPGQDELIFAAGIREHDESGRPLLGPAFDPGVKALMAERRLRKLPALAAELEPPRLEGPAGAELTLVAWGSSCGVLRRMVQEFNADGRPRLNFLPIRTLWPFPFREVSEVLYHARKVLVVEASADGQFARLIRQETGYYIPQRWLKGDGEAFDCAEARAKIEEVLGS